MIDYHHKITFEANQTEFKYQLFLMPGKSTYMKVKRTFTNLSGDEVIHIKGDAVPFVAKEYMKKRMTYNQPIFSEVFLIQDELPLQKWKISKEMKQIQSFLCRKAVTTFRGRRYVAWYTEDIPLPGGPWKFDGLPGLILEVSSVDGVLSIHADQLRRVEEKLPEVTKIEYSNDEYLSWEMYCKKYREVLSRIRKNMLADTEEDMSYDLSLNLVEDIGWQAK